MGTNHVELPDFLTPKRVEYAHGLAQRRMEARQHGFAEAGMRAARRRDAKLLKALEAGAEIIHATWESQYGRTYRDTGTNFGERVEATESQLWREAFRLCDEGQPGEQFCWVYGAAAWLCGYID